MKEIDLTSFNEIVLTDDIKYLRFTDKKNNKLYMVEDYSKDFLEDKIKNLNKLNTIDEVKNYFISKYDYVNIFEFIDIADIKKYYDVINKMDNNERKKLALIIKNVKNLNIKYLNFTYFFVETKAQDIYYVDYNDKENIGILKKLKIKQSFYPADYKKIVKDIKTYGAFKYQNKTIKYNDIKIYIDNPLLKPEQNSTLIDGIRNEFLKEKLENSNKILDLPNQNNGLNENKKIDDKIVSFEKKDSIKKDSKETIKGNKQENKKQSSDLKKSKSLFIYCFIGFSVGVLLAAITILIGNFI